MLPQNNKYSPLVAHIVYRLGVGGLENGLVNLINHMPADRYRHVIICLTQATAFKTRINARNVQIVELNKAAGHDFRTHRQLWQVLNQLRPDIIHTRNLATLEFQLTSALARIPGRVHGEHGRDMYDLDGTNVKYNLLRMAVRPFVKQYTAVSVDLAEWLIEQIKVPSERVMQIYNGVDILKFCPRTNTKRAILPEGFAAPDSFIIGTVGRLEPVKDPITLVHAFLSLLKTNQNLRRRLRLIVVGDGSLYKHTHELLRDSGMASLAWLPGERADIPELMRAMDVFVLPSLAEGISNTILEAMATGLPVVATNTGGNPELVGRGITGELVSHSNPLAMAGSIESYFSDSDKLFEHGRNARQTVERGFSMQSMIDGYIAAYDNVLKTSRRITYNDQPNFSNCII